MAADEKDTQLYEILKDIKDSTKFIERKVNDLEMSSVKQQFSLENQVKRTDALEKPIVEVRSEAKEATKFLRQEFEDKLKPTTEMHKTITGFWSVVKWILTSVIAVGGATAAMLGIIKLFG